MSENWCPFNIRVAHIHVHGQLLEKIVTILVTMKDSIFECLLCIISFHLHKDPNKQNAITPFLQRSELRHRAIK